MALKLNQFKNLSPGFKQFLTKTTLFILGFIIFSAIIGTQLFHYGLLENWKIEIYGRIGYILLFSIAGFFLLYRERLLKLEYFKHKPKDYLILILSFVFLIFFYFFEINAYRISLTLTNILLAHLVLLLTMFFLVLGIYGLDFIKKFVKIFKKELIYFLIFGIITASLMQTVWSLWPYFSLIVSKAVYFLLSLISDNIRLIPPNTIIFKSFGAQIAEACSGVYSIFLFTALYLFIVFVDWKKINKKRAILLFIPAVVGAFIVNILRVFLLFAVGAYVSKDVAMGMYHSYTGMIFFLIYFAIFWFLFYKWMKNEKTRFIPEDSLYKNSIYLMLSTFIMSIFGFAFWMINARLFTTEQVGLATAIISASSLIVSVAGLGLGAGIIRYLPTSERKNQKINTCFTTSIITTIIASTIFLLAIDLTSPKLHFIKDNLLLAFIFIIFMIFLSLNTIIESVFIAFRSAKYVFVKNSIFSVLKLIFPFLLVGFGAYGIFSSSMIAGILALLVVFIILIYKFKYKPGFVFYDSIIKKIGRYSFANYIAGIIGSLPTLLLPLIIVNMLAPEISAYYYMSMMIIGLLFVIPSATSNSLFAEGSHNEKSLKHNLWKSIKLISLFLIPAIIIIIFFGKYILLLLGKDYSAEGYMLLNILAISGIFVSINAIFTALFKVQKRIREIITRNLIGTILIIGLSVFFIKQDFGLQGIGYAYLIGQAVMTISYLISWKRKTKS